MRILPLVGAAALLAVGLSGCATTDRYAERCERERAENRAAAVAAGAAIGAIAGAAVAENDATGAAVGGTAGAALGGVLASRNDPCREYYLNRYGTPY